MRTMHLTLLVTSIVVLALLGSLTAAHPTQASDPQQATPVPLTPVPVTDTNEPARTFPETGHTVRGRFLAFWEAQGGLPIFGLPLSPQQQETSSAGTFEVQWFERERFELHPEAAPPYDVQLGRLGVELLERSGRDWQDFPRSGPQADCLFFQQTEHSVCEPFLSYWENNGLEFDGRAGTAYEESLALFGLPLSPPMMETNSSGATVLTQWFERARFEYVPDNPPPFQIQLGRLGAELLALEEQPADPVEAPAADPAVPDTTPPSYRQVQAPGWPAPLEVPQGFTVEEVASGLASPRFLAIDGDGSLIYASHTTGSVRRLIDTNNDDVYETEQLIAGDLPFVHSVALIDGKLFAAAEGRVVRLSNFAPDGRARSVSTVIGNIPTGATDLYGHRTRTLLEGPDGMVYLSVGSSCDFCDDDPPQRAAVLRTSIDIFTTTSQLAVQDMERFASGLRNTIGMDFRPGTTELWGMDMGRNNLGPDLPPEELNHIEADNDYGWPYCYGDREPDPAYNDPARCLDTTAPRYTFPAHWAPIGFVFYDYTRREPDEDDEDEPDVGFPAAYTGDALVAFHGSGPDQVEDDRIGYKVVRVYFHEGEPLAHEDLLRGFVAEGEVWGRPTGLLVAPDGSLLMSDDFGGRIFRISYVGN